MTSKEWKTCKIGELCNSVSDTHKRNDKKVILINTSDVFDGKILNNIPIENKNLKGQFKKTFKKDDILYSEIRPANRRFAYVNIGNTDNYIASTKLMVLRPNKNKILPKYLYLILKSDEIIKELQHLAETRSGTFPQITFNSELANIEILLPPLETQEKIVRLLSSLDDKIELNNKINQNLEQQADLLFNDLFLEDKDCIKLSEVISTTSGGTPSRKNLNFYTNGSFCWVKSKELNGTFITKTEEKINQLAIEKSSAKLLPPYSVLLAMYGATVGEYAIISKEMTCNQAICAIIPNEKYPYTYIYEYIKLSKEKIKTLAIGSAQQNISQVLIKDLPVHKNINKIKEYHFKTRNLFELIKNNQIENEKLKQLRDTLLPKLISGEIDVDRVEV